MRNFASATAIASALHSTAVDNLGVTRKALTRNMQSKLSDLYDIINPESNHRGYRDALHAPANAHTIETCVPWMAFHLKELGKVLRLYPVTIEQDGQHLINFNRYIKFMDRTKEIMYYEPPRLEEFRLQGQLAYLVNQIRSICPSVETEQRLMAKSRALMSQEASDYRTRKPQLVKLGFDF
jgi:son of sevenless-like protein